MISVESRENIKIAKENNPVSGENIRISTENNAQSYKDRIHYYIMKE